MLSFKQYSELFEEYEKSSQRLGSNEGGIFTDKKTGQRAYIKFPRDPEQAKVEVATDKLYQKMGIHTLGAELHKAGDRLGVHTKWRDNVKTMGNPLHQSFSEEHARQLATMLHAGVVTNNRDVVGLEFDNILHDGKHYISADQGGSMHFRAMGGDKPFDHEIPEVESFKNPRYTTGMLHHAITKHFPNVMRETAASVKHLSDTHIDSVIKEVGLDEKHGEAIKARRDLLLKHYGVDSLNESHIPSESELEDHCDDGECYEHSYAIHKKWPHLKIDAGYYMDNDRPKDHGWTIHPNGTIIDTTGSQFDHKPPMIIPPDHPDHKRYVSFERHDELARQINAKEGGTDAGYESWKNRRLG
jgi:hypothetical protein